MCYRITNWSRHCQTRTVDILNPNSLGATKPSSPILSLHDLSTRCYDSCFLFLVIRFMILSKLPYPDLSLVIWWDKNAPWITNIRCVQLISTEKCWCESSTWQLHIKHSIWFLLILTLNDCIIHGISYNLFLLGVNHFIILFIFFFRVWLLIYLLLFFCLSDEFF